MNQAEVVMSGSIFEGCRVELANVTRKMIDTRFELLGKLGEAPSVPNLVGVADPRQEIVTKLKFIDNSMVRLQDLIAVTDLLIEHYQVRREREEMDLSLYTHLELHGGRIDLSQYPAIHAKIDDIARSVWKAVNHPDDSTPNDEKLMIFGVAELWRKRKQLGL